MDDRLQQIFIERDSKVFYEPEKTLTCVSVQICGKEKGLNRQTLEKKWSDFYPTRAEFLEALAADKTFLRRLSKDGFLTKERFAALKTGDPSKFDTLLLVLVLIYLAKEILPEDVLFGIISDETPVCAKSQDILSLARNSDRYEKQCTGTQNTVGQLVFKAVNNIGNKGVGFAQNSDLFMVVDKNKVQVDPEEHSSSKVKNSNVEKIVKADEKNSFSYVGDHYVEKSLKADEKKHCFSCVGDHYVEKSLKADEEKHSSSCVGDDNVEKSLQADEEKHSSSCVGDDNVEKSLQADWKVHIHHNDHISGSKTPVASLLYSQGVKSLVKSHAALIILLLSLLTCSLACSVSIKVHHPIIFKKDVVIEANTTCNGSISWESSERIGSGNLVYNATKYILQTENGHSKLTVKDFIQEDFNKYRCKANFHLTCDVNITGINSGIIRNPQGPYKLGSVCKTTITSVDSSRIEYNLQVWGGDSVAQSNCSSEFLEIKNGETTTTFCRNTTLSNVTKGHLDIIFHSNNTKPGIRFELEYKIIPKSGGMQSRDAGSSHAVVIPIVVFVVGVVLVVMYFLRKNGKCKCTKHQKENEPEVKDPMMELEDQPDPTNQC